MDTFLTCIQDYPRTAIAVEPKKPRPPLRRAQPFSARLPRELVREMRSEAARRGVTLTAWISEGIRLELERSKGLAPKQDSGTRE